jgi:hypothetical protein
MEMRAQGNATPYAAFLTPFWDPTSTVQELYDKMYSKGLCEDLWFRWEGKPRKSIDIAGPMSQWDDVGPEYRDTIDVQFKWADHFQTEDDINAFTINGDSAPMGRFNYRFHAEREHSHN